MKDDDIHLSGWCSTCGITIELFDKNGKTLDTCDVCKKIFDEYETPKEEA